VSEPRVDRSPAFYGVCASVALHAALAAVAFARVRSPSDPAIRQVPIELFTPPPPVRAPIEPEPQPEPAPPPKALLRPAARTVRALARNAPPPDPVLPDRPPDPEAAPVRRVVGISMESTIEGGDPIAVGNTRMGAGSTTAEDPNSVHPLEGDFTPPVRRRSPRPAYPAALRARGVEGVVVVELLLSANGALDQVRIAHSSGFPEFDEAALLAARQGEYEPARVNRVPVADTIRFSIRFRLNE
jgi:protein TonB